MSDAKKLKYLTKTVKFGSSTVTLYSIDGLTWSSKKQELSTIRERLENQRVTLGDIKSEDEEEEGKAKPERDDEPVVTSSDDDEDEKETPEKDEDLPAEDDDLDDLDDLPAAPVASKKGSAKEAKAPAKAKRAEVVKPAPKKSAIPEKSPAKRVGPKAARKTDARSKRKAA